MGVWLDREECRRIGMLRVGVVVFGFALYWSYIFLVYFGPVTFVGAPADDLNNQLFRVFGHVGAGVFMLVAWRFGLPRGRLLRVFDWATALAAPVFVVATSLYAQGTIGPELTCAAWFVTGVTAGQALFATTAVLVRFGTGLAAFICIASTFLAACVYGVANAAGADSLLIVAPLITLSIACAVAILRDINAGLNADAIPKVFDGVCSNEPEEDPLACSAPEGRGEPSEACMSGDAVESDGGAVLPDDASGASASPDALGNSGSAGSVALPADSGDAGSAGPDGPRGSRDVPGAAGDGAADEGRRSLSGKNLARMLHLMNANALFHGLISGTVNCIVITTLSGSTPYFWAMFAAFVASCVIMCLLLKAFSSVMNLQTLALPVSGTIAVAALLLLGFTEGVPRLACAAVLVVCFTVHDIVNLVRLVDTVLRERLSTVKTCGSRRCFNSLGVAVGWLVGWAALPLVLHDGSAVLPISACLAFLLVVLLASQSICNIAFPVEAASPELSLVAPAPVRDIAAASSKEDCRAADAVPHPAAELTDKQVAERAIASLSRRYSLSARELDVLAPLVRGRSAQRIADELFLSKNTVRTHIYHIYAKMGLHTQQDVIDRYERECSKIRRGA